MNSVGSTPLEVGLKNRKVAFNDPFFIPKQKSENKKNKRGKNRGKK